MRLLHAGHADGGEGAARPQSESRPARMWSRRSPATSAAAPATSRSSTPILAAARAARARQREDGPMLEFRKDFFADERDDNLNEIGKATQRQDMLGHVTGRSPYFDDHRFEGLLHSRCCAARTTCPHPPHRHGRSGARARRAAHAARRGRAGQPEHAAEPDRLRQGRRAVARGRQGRATRASRSSPIIADSEAQALRRAWRRCGSTTSRCPQCSTSRRR